MDRDLAVDASSVTATELAEGGAAVYVTVPGLSHAGSQLKKALLEIQSQQAQTRLELNVYSNIVLDIFMDDVRRYMKGAGVVDGRRYDDGGGNVCQVPLGDDEVKTWDEILDGLDEAALQQRSSTLTKVDVLLTRYDPQFLQRPGVTKATVARSVLSTTT